MPHTKRRWRNLGDEVFEGRNRRWPMPHEVVDRRWPILCESLSLGSRWLNGRGKSKAREYEKLNFFNSHKVEVTNSEPDHAV
jgi:hypothetical protein